MALPVELLDQIARHLHRPNLRVLAAVSTRFRHVAQRLLYRHLVLDVRSLPCLFTLARSPAIARHVRTFSLRIPPKAHLLNPVYRALARALPLMSELTELDIALDHAASWVMRTSTDTRFHSLRSCSLSFPLDTHLADFFTKTPALRDLHIHSQATPHPIHTAALPGLQHFTGSSLIARTLVPGRPVHDIHLTSGDLTDDLAEALATSAAPVLLLAAATSSHSLSLLATLTRCMEHLVHLRIVTTYNFTDAPDTTYFSNVTDALAAFPRLQSCEIWGLHWVSSRKQAPRSPILTPAALLDDLHPDLSYV